ncbi:MAG: hypothetical protein ACP6IY_09180 [Promethearchaeia archaeon]
MNKKYLYGIFILSIFLLSTASSISATTYKFGVPDSAKGVETTSTVKSYDEDSWKDTVGSVTPDDLFGGDADKEGAKSKSKVSDWEEKKYSYFLRIIEGVEIDDKDFYTLLSELNETVVEQLAAVVGLYFQILSKNATLLPIAATIGGYYTKLNAGTITEKYVKDNYDLKVEVTLLKRDKWDFTTDDFSKNPDKEDEEVPFLANPSDLKKLWDKTDDLMGVIQNNVSNVYQYLTLSADALNDTAKYNISNNANYTLLLLQLGFPSYTPPDTLLDTLAASFIAEATLSITKKDFLVALLLEGIPFYTPVADFISEIIDDFDIKSITSDGSVITVEMEKGENSLVLGEAKDDYTIEFTYGDYGTQSSVVFKDADGNVIYEQAGEAIPGYEISIILSITALFTLGLIYTVMKKKR